jgi:hypothetical protein
MPENIGGLKSNDAQSRFSHVRIAALVTLRAIAEIVAEAIEFDREPRRRTIEVDDERAEWMLLAEFEASRAVAKSLPEQGFGEAHGAAQLARPYDRLVARSHHYPSTMLRMVPLPSFAGEEY